jgi:hypothetical protein
MMRLPPDWRTWPLVGGAIVLLNASLTFAGVWPTPKIRWQYAVSVELAACVLLLAVLRRPSNGLIKRVLPSLWLVLVIGRYLDVTAPNLYGRPFNLYWDSPHLKNVVAMFVEAAPLWVTLLGTAAALVAVVSAFLCIRAALGWVADAMQQRHLRGALGTLAAAGIALFAFGQPWKGDTEIPVFAKPVIPAYVRQARSVLAMMGPWVVAPSLGPSPAALASMPSGLAAADVHLVFVESYGAITFESPMMAATLDPSRATFEAAAKDTGRQVVSAYVESPTFGGSSWLAHLSLLSGVEVRDQYSYQSLMTQSRDTLVTTFRRAGYRTVALMPGMRQAWPEGAFYGYDTMYGRTDLDYTGPRFGWWSIPDQYALAKLDALEGPRSSRAPLFVVFPTSTTHAPFGPVAPYQPDWSRVLGAEAYDPVEVERILGRTPDWTNLSSDYAHAMAYEFRTFAGYLREHEADDLVIILIGDHQPPAAVAGEGASWAVPVHVITNRARVIARLLTKGFRPGLAPTRPSLGQMHELVPVLLGAFDGADE